MKLLKRLRALAGTFPLEPADLSLTYGVTPLDPEQIECEEDFAGETLATVTEKGMTSPTVDGLRRRLPDVHEEVPPEGYQLLSDGTAALD